MTGTIGKPKPPKGPTPTQKRMEEMTAKFTFAVSSEIRSVHTKNRVSILSFMDSLFAACLAFGVVQIAPHVAVNGIHDVRELMGKVIPVLVGVVWVAEDWTSARLILQERGYPENSIRATIRFYLDLMIAALSFGLILAAVPFRPFWYISAYAAISGLGLWWGMFIQKEGAGTEYETDPDVRAIIASHLVPFIVLTVAAIAIYFMIQLAASNGITPKDNPQLHMVHRGAWWAEVVFPVIIMFWHGKNVLSFRRGGKLWAS